MGQTHYRARPGGKPPTMNAKKRIKLKVMDILGHYNITSPPVPVENIALDMGLVIRREPLEEGDVSGLLYQSGTSAMIGVNSQEPPTRQRFTIAHELGHFLLHGKQKLYVDKGFRIHLRDQTSSEATDRQEIEANQFAAELLMPEEMVRRMLGTQMIDIESDADLVEWAKRFEISTQALIFRLANLGIIALDSF
jgi:Zn-dependent peptidase ImmA (M78 family)